MHGRIAVIGTGNMAKGLAHRITQAKLELFIGGRDADKALSLARTLNIPNHAGSIEFAVSMADIVVLAIPYVGAVTALKSAGNLGGKVIVDITNPITPDFMALTLGYTTSAAEEIQAAFPSVPVVKAFNTVFSTILHTANKDVQVFYATNNDNAGDIVADFISSIGFIPVKSGPLSNARFLEPLAEMNIHFGYVLGHGTLTAPAWVRFAA